MMSFEVNWAGIAGALLLGASGTILHAADDVLDTKRKDIRLVPRDDPEASTSVSRFAVVVGVGSYKSDGLSRLRFPEKDARDVANALKDAGWNHVSLLTPDQADLRLRPETKTDIESRLREFATQATEKDVLLFYYSGHGFVGPDQEGYVCPSHIDPSSEASLAAGGVALDHIRKLMHSSKSTKQLLILDACRNDPRKSALPRNGYSERDLDAAVGLGVLYATAPGKCSFEPLSGERDEIGKPMNNGIFTHYLLRGLAGEAQYNNDDFLTFRELSCYVADRIATFTLSDDKIEYRQQKPFLDWVGGVNDDVILKKLGSNRAVALRDAEPPSPSDDVAKVPPKQDHDPAQPSDAATTLELPQAVLEAIKLLKAGASGSEIRERALPALESASKATAPLVSLTASAFLGWAYDRLQQDKSSAERFTWAGTRARNLLIDLNQNFEPSRLAVDIKFESISMRAMSLYYEAALAYVAWEVASPEQGKKQFAKRSEKAKVALELQQFADCKDFAGRKFLDLLKERCPRLFPK